MGGFGTYTGLLHKSTGDGNALLLATRELDTALADHGVVLVGQRRDKVVCVGLLGRLLDLGLAHVVVQRAQGNVLADGRGKEDGLLLHERNLGAEPLEVELLGIDAVQRDRALV